VTRDNWAEIDAARAAVKLETAIQHDEVSSRDEYDTLMPGTCGVTFDKPVRCALRKASWELS
jgi:hypothetical protein